MKPKATPEAFAASFGEWVPADGLGDFEWFVRSRSVIRLPTVLTEHISPAAIRRFLDQGEWDEAWRSRLRSEFDMAVDAFRQGERDLAVWIMRALHRECSRLGMVEAVRPAFRRDAARQAGASLGAAKSAKARARLPPPTQVLAEFKQKCAAGSQPTAAKEALRRRYGVTRRAINDALKKAEAT